LIEAHRVRPLELREPVRSASAYSIHIAGEILDRDSNSKRNTMDTQPSDTSNQPDDRWSPSHDEPKRHHTWVWVIVFLVFALVVYLVLRHHDNSAGSAQSSRRGQMGPVTINTVTAQKGDIGVYLSAIGTVPAPLRARFPD
jgi:hypothetical protein